MTEVYSITPARGKRLPILISSPHSGVAIPDDLNHRFDPDLAERPDDADWYVDRLYEFAPDMGITVIQANYCRWVVDLNRSPNDEPLYKDGRHLTGLVPTTNFLGKRLYLLDQPVPTDDEIHERKAHYYRPYHSKITELLSDLLEEFDHVLLYDAHSIRRRVPTIHFEPFPDLILGDQDGETAHPDLIAAAVDVLSSSDYTFSHNKPFKGGYITRHYGRPHQGIHTFQLERAKDLYMDDDEIEYHPARAAELQTLLKAMLERLAEVLARLD